MQACEFTAGIRQFAGLEAKILGCSPDSPETHQKFIAKHKLGIDLLSDPERKVMEKYDAYGEKNMYGKKTMGVIRSTVIIDPDGRIAHHWKRVQAKGHADSVKKRLKELQAES